MRIPGISIQTYLRNITVKTQFVFAGMISVVLLLALCIYGIVQLDATNRQTSRLSHVHIPALKTSNTIYVEFLKIPVNSRIDAGENRISITNIDKEIQTLLNYDLTLVEFDRLQELIKSWNELKSKGVNSPEVRTGLESAIISLEQAITEEARLRSITVGELFTTTRHRVVLLLIIGVIIIIVFYYNLTKLFLAPLNKGLGLVRSIQRGDLSARIDITGNNEICSLCQALNKACVALEEKAKLENEQNEKIYQANKLISLGTLVAGVAHEINNPNSNITFNTPLLHSLLSELFTAIDAVDDEFDNMPGEYDELRADMFGMVDTIEKSAYRIKAIIERLKDYSRPVLEPKSFVKIDLLNLVNATIELIGKQLEKSISHIDLDLPENKILIQGNFIRLEQVLVNILNNAKEAMADMSEPSLLIRVYETELTAVIEVVDNGVGIDESIKHQITDPFFTTKRSINGTGLGLSVVAAILGEHNAGIDFFPNETGGTRVVITFNKA